MNIYVVHGKSTLPGDPAPFKAYVIVADSEQGARQLVPSTIRVDFVEAGNPAQESTVPLVIYVFEITIETYNP